MAISSIFLGTDGWCSSIEQFWSGFALFVVVVAVIAVIGFGAGVFFVAATLIGVAFKNTCIHMFLLHPQNARAGGKIGARRRTGAHYSRTRIIVLCINDTTLALLRWFPLLAVSKLVALPAFSSRHRRRDIGKKNERKTFY